MKEGNTSRWSTREGRRRIVYLIGHPIDLIARDSTNPNVHQREDGCYDSLNYKIAMIKKNY